MTTKRKPYWKIEVSLKSGYGLNLREYIYFDLACIRYTHGRASYTYSAYTKTEVQEAIADLKKSNNARHDVEVIFQHEGDEMPLMSEADWVIFTLKYSEQLHVSR